MGSPSLEARRSATQSTLDQFAGKPFAFGSVDCGLMVISHLKAMGWPIRTGGTWRSMIGLKRWLKKHGGSGAACIDNWGLPQITPAATILGDIVQMEGDPVFGCFGVCLGNGRVLAFHEDVEGAAVIQPITPPIRAWRT